MFWKTFQFRITTRVLLLAATLLLFAFIVAGYRLPFLTVAVFLLAVFQVYSLIRFTEKTNRDLSRFLLSIKYDDTSQSFRSEGLGSSFTELKEAFGLIMRKIREKRSEAEVHARYLNTIIQHVGIGLLIYKTDGTVDLINNPAKKLLNVAALRNINDLKRISPDLVAILQQLKHGDKKLVKIYCEEETRHISLSSCTFLLREEKYLLVSLQNIQAELEEKEMEAWQNLVRVLTHEIVNSITPISSMTATLLDSLGSPEKNRDADANHLSPEEIEETAEALKTIHQRSQGLMNFVNSYRNMTLIPEPQFEILPLLDFFTRVEKLMKPRLTAGAIDFRQSVEPKTLELTADPNLMEQVMINLVLNAIHAVDGRKDPCIRLLASLSPENTIIITVEDNGAGIAEEALEKIFIPFFTTTKQGSGIGLSLSRQILRMHNATISARSIPDKGTVFTMRFH
jgi:two-component system nitrogen regulation sensor histidine kinase NtrY